MSSQKEIYVSKHEWESEELKQTYRNTDIGEAKRVYRKLAVSAIRRLNEEYEKHYGEEASPENLILENHPEYARYYKFEEKEPFFIALKTRTEMSEIDPGAINVITEIRIRPVEEG